MSDEEVSGEAVEVWFSSTELADLDAWVAACGRELSRSDAVKALVREALAISREWEAAKTAAQPDEGLRPDQLTTENDL